MRHMITIGGILVSLALTAPYAVAQTSGKYCLKQTSGALDCIYATMAQCNQDKAVKNGQCISNPNATTGSGSNTDSQK
ncbi:MAG: DUF3551 domain-containing protein [Rhizobiales bacterium]|nr:DUF3551 domain-containing protein [Hyphomicrobiales bacterium]